MTPDLTIAITDWLRRNADALAERRPTLEQATADFNRETDSSAKVSQLGSVKRALGLKWNPLRTDSSPTARCAALEGRCDELELRVLELMDRNEKLETRVDALVQKVTGRRV